MSRSRGPRLDQVLKLLGHGGIRPGAGRPPEAGERRTKLLRIPLTNAELAELMAAAGDQPTATWGRDLLLSAARR